LASTKFTTAARAAGHPYHPGPRPSSILQSPAQQSPSTTNFLHSLQDAPRLNDQLPQSLEGRLLSVIVSEIEAHNLGAPLSRVWALTNSYLLRQYSSPGPRRPSFTRAHDATHTPPSPLNPGIPSLSSSYDEASGSRQGRSLSHPTQDPYSNPIQPQTIKDEGVSGRRGSSHSTHTLNRYDRLQGAAAPSEPSLSPDGRNLYKPI
jgi:hypothetical protein